MTEKVCPYGHPIGSSVVWDAGAGTGTYCPRCGVSLDGRRDRGMPPEWLIWLGLALVLVGAYALGASNG